MAQQRKIGNSDKSMTAVGWLYDKLKSHFDYDGDLLEGVIMTVEQAKQMEKEQIISAHKEGNKYNGWALRHEHEKYYNETYGTTNSS